MSITLEQVTKHYGGHAVVNDVSLEIGDGEFFVLLGPSGSGKSTLLRAIAGLIGVDHGTIAMHGRDVTRLAARKRGVGLVFQNYALFRHMTVADNIEFALRVRHVRGRLRRERRRELLRLVALEGMDDRFPAQLSGGQQQRVAVARALAHKPEVLLLDEPFGALDARIREELRRTIREVQRELGITTVLVTHDQEEAFAMADRIGIMNLGRLLEVGVPAELYSHPATRFVATFLGDANLILARRAADGVHVGAATLAAGEAAAAAREQEVVAVVRPEDVEVAASRAELGARFVAQGTVDELTFTGALERMRIELENGAALLAGADNGAIPHLQVTRTQHEQRGFVVHPGQSIAVGIRRMHVLPTPLSSFTACAADEAQAEALARAPLLTELAARMKTRIATRAEPQLGAGAPAAVRTAFVGATVLASGPQAARRAAWLLEAGAGEVLVLPAAAGTPQHVLVLPLDEAVRSATLAVAASVLRHVPAEAQYLREAHAGQSGGELAQQLARALAAVPEPMLILGITGLEGFAERCGALLEGGRWPVLIVYRPAGRTPA